LTSGGTKGIGRAITLDLATRGSSVVATFASPGSANTFEHLQAEIESMYQEANLEAPKLVGITADITASSALAIILDVLSSYFDGKLDILVFNAAVMSLARIGEGKMDDAFLDRFLAGNLRFPIRLIDQLVERGGFRPGSRVVAISSEAVRARRPPGGYEILLT
jgi:3-oxoacyl-[acyl-carrier protein] reductase